MEIFISMGKHVNHYDVQDRLIDRNSRINKHTGSLEQRDPSTLSIAEQEILMAKILANKKKAAAMVIKTPPKVRFTGKKP